MTQVISDRWAALAFRARAYLRTTLGFILVAPLCSLIPAATANERLSAGATLLDAIDDPALYDRLHNSTAGIVSPDGKHLYLRATYNENALINVLSLSTGGNHTPSLIRTYSKDSEDISGPALTISGFNSAGTRAYAHYGSLDPSVGQDDLWGVAVLERNPQTGDLRELQRVTVPQFTYISGAPVVSSDGRNLYVAYASINSDFNVSGALRSYELQAETGLLGTFTNVETRQGELLGSITLADEGNRLLASSTEEIIEFQRAAISGQLSEVARTLLPPLPNPADSDTPPQPPRALAVTTDGRSLYSISTGFIGYSGGFLSTFSRNPATGDLQLIDDLTPEDMPENGLFEGTKLLLTQAEDVLLAPAYYARFIAGSPSISACVNAFARDSQTGRLRTAGTQCDSFNIGPSWVAYPGKDLYYTAASQPRNLFGSGNQQTTRLVTWGIGRIPEVTNIHAAVLPLSRSIGDRETNSEPATYFTSVLNAGTEDALQCRIDYSGDLPISVRFQVNDTETNEPLTPERFDQQFEVPAGGVQQLLLTVFQFGAFETANIDLNYGCVNTESAPVIRGVTTLLLSSSDLPLPDLITGAVTPGNTGISRLPTPESASFFAVSTINIGAEDDIRAIPVFDLGALISNAESGVQTTAEATLLVCETNPATGACLAPPSAETVRRLATNEIATYTVFIQGNGNPIALDPANNRAFIALIDSTGEVRGASSVAITTTK